MDPYVDYYGTGVLWGIGGGHNPTPLLEPKPYEIELTLNDWFRFDRPGKYRLYLKSHRLGRGQMQFAAVSNVLEVEITERDVEWERTRLGETGELRYLASQEAVEAALENARRTEESPEAGVLLAARDRARAIAAYDQYLEDPSTAVREWDLEVRTLFRFLEKEKPTPLPMHVWQMPTNAVKVRWVQMVAQRRHDRFRVMVREEALRWIPLVTRKNSRAREAAAIAAIVPEAARKAGLVPPEDWGLSRHELIAQLGSFPEDQQMELLGRKWDLIRGADAISVVRAVVMSSSGAAETAMRRLHELAPEEARKIARVDIASGRLRFEKFALYEMDPAAIPEADAVFARWVARRDFGRFPLLTKFGPARFGKDVRRVYVSRERTCWVDAALVAYLVRALPENDAREVLRDALSLRKDRGCYKTLLRGLPWNAVVEAQAIASLDDPDAETAAMAARVLAMHGDARVEAILWRRLEAWSAAKTQTVLGDALMDAIGSAKSWVLDKSRLKRQVVLCIEDHCRKQWSGGVPKVWRVEAAGQSVYATTYEVGGYRAPTMAALQAKLLLYPKRSVFRWCSQSGDWLSAGQIEEMFQSLRTFTAEQGLRLEPYVAAKCLPGGE
ncbi:MAG: hypothetical protein HY820_38380 [Acidobacteria bacterium]|nr:hypothetical protein [Acidobacteriota bacterium]